MSRLPGRLHHLNLLDWCILLHVFFMHCRCPSLVSGKYLWEIFVFCWFSRPRSEFSQELSCSKIAFERVLLQLLSDGFEEQLSLKTYNYQGLCFHVPSHLNSIWATVSLLFISMLFWWHWADEACLSNLDYLFTNDPRNVTFIFAYLIDYQGIFLTPYPCNLLLCQRNE